MHIALNSIPARVGNLCTGTHRVEAFRSEWNLRPHLDYLLRGRWAGMAGYAKSFSNRVSIRQVKLFQERGIARVVVQAVE